MQPQDLSYHELKEWMDRHIDPSKIDPMLAEELANLLEDKRLAWREELHKVDIAEWAVDMLGDDIESWKWSMHGGAYETHNWDSRIHTRRKDEDDQWQYPYTNIEDPLWHAGRALADPDGNRTIVLPSATGCGKTWSAARMVLWFMDQFPGEAKALYFANAIKQLRLNIGSEIEKLITKKNPFTEKHPGMAYHRSTVTLYMDNSDDSAREAWSARGYGAATKAGDEATGGAKGTHAPYQLFVVEELQSAEQALIKSLTDGMRGTWNRFLGLCNPLGQYDMSYKMATQARTTWISISSLDFPNVVLKKELVPGAASAIDIEETWEKVEKNEDHPDWMGPIRGMYPMGSAKAIMTSTLANKIAPFIRKRESAPIYTVHEGPDKEGYTAFWRDRARGDYVNWCYVSMDMAGDELDGDWHVALFFDRIEREFFGIIRMRGDRVHFFHEVVNMCQRMGTYWESRAMSYLPMLSWEKNYSNPSSEDIIGRYPNAYREKKSDRMRRRKSSSKGFNTNDRTRFEMQERIKEYLAWVHSEVEAGKASPLYIEDVVKELTKFVAQKKTRKDGKTKYAAAPGFNDDCVLAMGQNLFINAEYSDEYPLPIGVGSTQPYTQVDRSEPEQPPVVQTPGSQTMDKLSKWKPRKWL